MSFIYPRTIRLSDTDAAGVVYFANILTICHEAYEESLVTAGINLKQFVSNPETAIPIVHASVDFFRPMFCGDKVLIRLTPQQRSENEFEISYSVIAASSLEQQLATAATQHVCINPSSRSRIPLPEAIAHWLRRTLTS